MNFSNGALSGPGPGALPVVRMRIIGGREAGREVGLVKRTVVVGSSEGCDVVLREPTVSRRHASLELLDEGVRVRDLGSEHGTWYLAARLSELDVPMGSTLGLGATHVVLLPGDVPPERVSGKAELAGLVGPSVPMRRLFADMERAASSEAPVLIQGETGVGKELVARGLHALSPRAEGPLVVFHCGAVQPSLAQSQLFGHARGAFTGASRDVAGVLGRADGGTLFLDEVGELPLALQPLLLRVLETRTFSRLGEGSLRSSDFRLVATSRWKLEALVRRGAFRADLFHRLASILLQVPPLRERPEDIAPLVRRFAPGADGGAVMDPALLASLQAYPWPGNVRELRNVVEQVAAFGPGALPGGLSGGAPPDFHQARELALQSFERAYLVTMLERHGARAAAARAAGLSRSHFYRLLEGHGLVRGGTPP
jgi:DNA-binding NtrC family response regulator